jgi:hypothetical protein
MCFGEPISGRLSGFGKNFLPTVRTILVLSIIVIQLPTTYIGILKQYMNSLFAVDFSLTNVPMHPTHHNFDRLCCWASLTE